MESNLFKVFDWNKSGDLIYVKLEKNDISIPITISLKSYELWLRVNRKLCYKLDYKEDKSITTHEGNMDYNEYWQNGNIELDLYEYITTNPIIYRGEVCQDSVNSILNAFINHRL